MTDGAPFSVDIGKLKAKPKGDDQRRIAAVDKAAEEHGFIQREAGAKRGRVKSPRTGQVHAKVLPHVADEIAEEARERGVTQGVLIEEAWQAFQESKRTR